MHLNVSESDCVALKAQRMPALIRDVQGRFIFHFFRTLFYILLSKINWWWCQQNFEAFFYNNFFLHFFFSFFLTNKKTKKNFLLRAKNIFHISLPAYKILLYIMSISCIPFVGLT